MTKKPTLFLALLCAGLVCVALGAQSAAGEPKVADAAPPVEFPELKLVVDESGEHDCVGRSVALDGDTLMAGAKGDDDFGSNSGAVYVFRREGTKWVKEAKLKASDAEIDDFFGFSVGVDGDLAVVGAWQEDDRGNGAGAAYVFRRIDGAWKETAKITAPDGGPFDQFGYASAVYGGTIVVGARSAKVGDVEDAGAAYVFEHDGRGWVQKAKLINETPATIDMFGGAVAVHGDTIVIGASGDDVAALNAGSASVYKRRGDKWVRQGRLLPTDPRPEDAFGFSVGVSSDTVMVGSFRRDDAGADSGAIFAYERDGDGWTHTQRLVASDADHGELFGWSLDISGDKVIVGAWHDRLGGDPEGPPGSAYLFARDDGRWALEKKLVSPKRGALDLFGWAVAIEGETVAIGARFDDDAALEAGAVYVR